MPRILDFLDDQDLAATFFVPGHTVESPLERIGVTPLGFRSPSADLSPVTLELVEELGWPHFQFNFDPYRKGGATPSQVLEIWEGEFDWMDEHVDGGILTVCMHPQVIGRGHRMAMLARFVAHCRDAGARFERMGDVARALPAEQT